MSNKYLIGTPIQGQSLASPITPGDQIVNAEAVKQALDIEEGGSVEWGSIGGSLEDQEDLVVQLSNLSDGIGDLNDSKQDVSVGASYETNNEHVSWETGETIRGVLELLANSIDELFESIED